MTVSIGTNKDAFTGDGTNAVLATTFPFVAAADLIVTQRITATGVETTLVLGTHYTVTGGDYAVGNVTVVDGATDFPNTVTWTITRDTPKTQLTDYVDNDNFGAETHEKALDKATMIASDGVAKIDRALKVSITDDDPADLPSSGVRASKYLGFDGSGNPAALDAPTDTSVTTVFSASLLDDVNAAAARTTLDAQQNLITTRGDIIRGNSSGVAERHTLGASATYLRSNGTDAAFAALVAADVIAAQQLYPRSYMAGLTVTRPNSTLFDVGLGVTRAGSAADQDLVDIENTNSAFGKLFDNNGWDPGDAGGGVPSAAGFAASIDTWHFFILVKQDGSAYDFGWDTDPEAATLIADAAVITKLGSACYFRRLISRPSTATPNFVACTQIGDEFLLAVPVLDYNDVTADITSAETVTLASVPDGIRVKALIRASHTGTAAEAFLVRSSIETDAAPSPTAAPLANTHEEVGANASGGELEVWTNTSQAIFMRVSADTTTDNYIVTRGWIDRRGRDD